MRHVTLIEYFWPQGFALLIVSFIVGFGSAILSDQAAGGTIRINKKEILPFESFGISYEWALLHPLRSFFVFYKESFILGLATRFDGSLVTFLICLPGCLYVLALCLLARINPVSLRPND